MAHSRTAKVKIGLPRASILDTTRVITAVVVPPQVVALAEKLDADRRAVRLLQRLRARHGLGPLRPRLTGRSVALMLSPEHVQRVLSGSPEPFAVANREKRGALSHFQPHGVLVSHGWLGPTPAARPHNGCSPLTLLAWPPSGPSLLATHQTHTAQVRAELTGWY